MLTGFWWKSLGEKKDCVEDLGIHWVDNTCVRMDEVRIGMDWICLVQDTDQWQAVVSNVVYYRVQ